MIFVYFVLLLFFSTTYGGLKIGYLKPWDVFFSQVFALVCVGIISYFQISLMEVRMVTGVPIMEMVLFQIAVEDGKIARSRYESYIRLYQQAKEINLWELNT